MEKYKLIPEQLLYEGTVEAENLFEPAEIKEELILTTHDPIYWNHLKNLMLGKSEARKIGFPLSKTLIMREKIITQGTIDCAKYAIDYGIAMNVAGGTHHAFRDRGEGFCMLNDFAIAANYLLLKGLASQILIIDLDVHQGNGTAALFQDNPKVFTMSVHGAKNYPLRKEKSDLDVPLEDGTNDMAYLGLLSEILPDLIEKVRPDFIFYLSGVDVLDNDKLGRISMTINGCKKRDEFVLSLCKTMKIPVAVGMGGGYSIKLADIVEAHSNTFRLAQEIFF